MKAYLDWAKKTVGAGIAFTVLWLSTLTPSTIPEWVPTKYLPVFTLLVGVVGTYSVWKLENGPKPATIVKPPVDL